MKSGINLRHCIYLSPSSPTQIYRGFPPTPYVEEDISPWTQLPCFPSFSSFFILDEANLLRMSVWYLTPLAVACSSFCGVRSLCAFCPQLAVLYSCMTPFRFWHSTPASWPNAGSLRINKATCTVLYINFPKVSEYLRYWPFTLPNYLISHILWLFCIGELARNVR